MLNRLCVTTEEVKESVRHGDSPLFIELRQRHLHEWALFKARGALCFETGSLEQHLAEIPHDRPIIVYSECRDEDASTRAARTLLIHGWKDVHTLSGGFDAYLEAGLAVERISKNVPATDIMWL